VQGHGHGDVKIQENVEGPQTPEQLMEHWLLSDMQLLGEDFMETLFHLTTLHYGQISFSWWLWNPSSKIVMHLNQLLTAACSSGEFSKCHSTLYQTLHQFSIWDEVPFLFVTWTQITWHKFLYPWSWLCTFDKHIPSKSITTTTASNMMCTFW
jgi:hypothetical protein